MKPWLKNILSAVIIVAAGFVLFFVAFLLTALVSSVTEKLFGPEGRPYLSKLVMLFIVLLISFFVFRSRFNDLVKASFLTMPLMVVLVLLGILMYPLPQWQLFVAGALIIGALVFFLYKKKLSWLYFFATFYVTVLVVIILLTGMEI